MGPSHALAEPDEPGGEAAGVAEVARIVGSLTPQQLDEARSRAAEHLLADD